MLQLNNFSAWIAVDGVGLPEHNVEISKDASGDKATCWIASQVGKNFTFNWKDSLPYRNFATGGYIKADGIACGGRAILPGFSGSVATVSEVVASATTTRSLVFAPLKLTDDESVDSAAGKAIGELAISIWKVKLVGSSRPISPLPPAQEVRVHERSKKAFAHRVGFGEEKKASHQMSSTEKLDANPIATFTFKYRPLEFLQAEGIIPIPVKEKRRALESPELITKDEDDSDAEEARILEEKLKAIQKKRLMKSSGVKKVKAESKPVFIPGEVIDLT